MSSKAWTDMHVYIVTVYPLTLTDEFVMKRTTEKETEVGRISKIATVLKDCISRLCGLVTSSSFQGNDKK